MCLWSILLINWCVFVAFFVFLGGGGGGSCVDPEFEDRKSYRCLFVTVTNRHGVMFSKNSLIYAAV